MILPEHEANRFLAQAGVPVVPLFCIDSREDLLTRTGTMGYPVVLKLSSSRHTHKTEAGCVFLNLETEAQVLEAYEILLNRRDELDPEGVIILEPMAGPGAELFLGVQDHPQFGAVMSFGLGGIWLELNPDVSFRLIPAEQWDFREMLRELKTWPALSKGFRHLPPVDEGLVLQLMQKVSELIQAHPEVRELDLNPILVVRDGPVVVDATVVLHGDRQAHGRVESAPGE